METDICFEFDCKDNTKRSKGRKNRQQRDFKQFAKSGSVRKLIMSDGKNFSSDKHSSQKADPFGLNCNVQYSLNKQGRWAKIPAMQSVDQLEDLTDAKVSTIENVYLDSTRLNLLKSKAFHEVDEAGDVISRRAKGYSAQTKTLTEKRKDSKIDEEVVIIPDTTAHIRYEINVPHSSEKYWQQMAWRRHELPSGKVFNTRARQLERQFAMYSSDDDYYSNSDTESDAAEEIFMPEDDHSEQKQLSLHDFITKTERKPKKSEGFVFLNAEN